jgi:hypothetical protein
VRDGRSREIGRIRFRGFEREKGTSGAFLKYDLEKYKIVASMGLRTESQAKKNDAIMICLGILVWLIISYYFELRLLIVLLLFPVLVLIHEFIHWLAGYILTGEIDKFGCSGLNPCVYSENSRPRNIAIMTTMAPLIGLGLLISAIWIMFDGTQIFGWQYHVIALAIFISNITLAWHDIKMVIFYIQKGSKNAIVWGDKNYNYLMEPKKIRGE